MKTVLFIPLIPNLSSFHFDKNDLEWLQQTYFEVLRTLNFYLVDRSAGYCLSSVTSVHPTCRPTHTVEILQHIVA